MNNIRRLILGFAGLLALTGAHAADKAGTPVARPVLDVARILQAKLPALAEDGMCEVSREGNGWNFEIRLKSGDGSADQVQIMLRAMGDSKSELRVQGVHTESSLITSARKVDPSVSKEWTEKLLKLIENPG